MINWKTLFALFKVIGGIAAAISIGVFSAGILVLRDEVAEVKRDHDNAMDKYGNLESMIWMDMGLRISNIENENKETREQMIDLKKSMKEVYNRSHRHEAQ